MIVIITLASFRLGRHDTEQFQGKPEEESKVRIRIREEEKSQFTCRAPIGG